MIHTDFCCIRGGFYVYRGDIVASEQNCFGEMVECAVVTVHFLACACDRLPAGLVDESVSLTFVFFCIPDLLRVTMVVAFLCAMLFVC